MAGNVIAFLDPKGAYPQANPVQHAQACGLLTQWAYEWFVDARPDLPLSQHMTETYGFPTPPLTEARILDDYLTYPGDPDSAPIFKVTNEETTLLIFPHALIAIQDTPVSSWFITRMD